MIATVSGEHPDMAFDFAMQHRDAVAKRVDSTSSSRYYPGLAGQSLDPAMVGKLRAYADKYLSASSRRPTETAIATIEYRTKVKRERLPAIDAWLGKHGG